VTSFLVVCPTAPGRLDGVADYAGWLSTHLSATAPTVLVGLGGEAGGQPEPTGAPLVHRVAVPTWRELWRTRRSAPFCQGVAVLQYVPQLYLNSLDFGWLVLWLATLRLSGRPVVVTVHEYAVPAEGSAKRAAGRAAMLAVILVVGSLATRLVVTFDLPRRRLGRLLFWKSHRIVAVPVGSNIPVPPSIAPRGGAGLTCAIFGQPEAMRGSLVAAIGGWLAQAGEGTRVRWIGRSQSAIEAFLRAHCGESAGAFEVAAGRSAAEVSALLADSDVCLAPIVDGVSSRRTTVAAALAHGLPIVGTDGICTDEIFRWTEACRLVSPDDAPGFVREVDTLAADHRLRRRRGRAARDLFEMSFSWDRITRAYLTQLSTVARRT
jgi:hypothetical protein